MFPVQASNISIITVAVIDTGVNYEKSEDKRLCQTFNTTKEPPEDFHGHGSNIVGLILKNTKPDTKYCINSYKGFAMNSNATEAEKAAGYRASLEAVLLARPTIVNISAGGLGQDQKEKELIVKMLDLGIIVVVAAGNEAMDLSKDCAYFPACIDSRLIVVGNGKNGKPNHGAKTNHGGPVEVYVDGQNQTGLGITMSGSSQSTAIVTAKIIEMVAKGDSSYKEWMK